MERTNCRLVERLWRGLAKNVGRRGWLQIKGQRRSWGAKAAKVELEKEELEKLFIA